jgi:hypothetical protein
MHRSRTAAVAGLAAATLVAPVPATAATTAATKLSTCVRVVNDKDSFTFDLRIAKRGSTKALFKATVPTGRSGRVGCASSTKVAPGSYTVWVTNHEIRGQRWSEVSRVASQGPGKATAARTIPDDQPRDVPFNFQVKRGKQTTVVFEMETFQWT